jgi:hypothetical protein
MILQTAWGMLQAAKTMAMMARAQCYKTFYGRNLRIFVLS